MDTPEQSQRAYDRIMLELTARTAMMFTHGSVLALVGFAMMFTGAPAPVEEAYGPWSRLILGGAALLIGLTILYGAAETDNEPAGWKALAVGFAGAIAWHLGLAATYAASALHTRMPLLGLGEEFDAGMASRGYIPLIYLGYVLLTGIHLRTIWKLGPPPR